MYCERCSDLLWSSPEHLRNDDMIGSREGDVYSFGIISAELITRSSAFDLENRKEDAEEIIYMLKKGGLQSPRPSLEHDPALEINPALVSRSLIDLRTHLVPVAFGEGLLDGETFGTS